MEIHWNVSVSYRPKTGKPDEVYWEITRDDEMQTVIDAGRATNLVDALEDATSALDDDVITHYGRR
jgi:hypothetical protein